MIMRFLTSSHAAAASIRRSGTTGSRQTAFFSLADGRRAEFEMGECTCPLEFNCKHVVALVLSVLEPGSPGPAQPKRPSARRVTAALRGPVRA